MSESAEHVLESWQRNEPPLDLATTLTPEAIARLLDEHFATDRAEAEKWLASAGRFDEQTPNGVQDDETYARAVTLVVGLRKWRDAAKAKREALVRPVLDAEKAINTHALRGIIEPLHQAADAAERKAEVWSKAETARKQAELAADAKRLQEEAQRALIAAATAQGPEAAEAMREAEATLAAAAKVQAIAEAPLVDLSRQHTQVGGLPIVSSVKSKWAARVVNKMALLRAVLIGFAQGGTCPCCGTKLRKLPENWIAAAPHLVVADDKALNVLARSSKGNAVVPGVEFFDEGGMTIRRV